MKPQNLDHKVQQAFKEMSDSDFGIAQDRKEAVWQKLSINQSKPRSKRTKNRWWLWFLLGTLFSLVGLGIKELVLNNQTKTHTETISNDLMAEVKTQIDVLQSKLELSRASQSLSKQKLDSILMVNQKLQDKLLALSIKTNNDSQKASITKYLTDTVYISKIETKELIVEHTVKDTIYIEVPIVSEDPEILAKSNNKSENTEKNITNPRSKRPASIQFNFSEVDIN